MNIRILSVILAMTCALGSTAVQAQTKPVVLTSSVQLVQTTGEGANARQTLVDAASVVPGDILVFSTAYRNSGAEQVNDFVILNPVPATVLVAGESATAQEVSVDGGRTFGALAALTVPAADGKTRPALNTDVTHLRWTIAHLAPGETGSATYRAVVR